MSDTLKAALIALVGTAILAPLVVRCLAWLGEKRSQLLVVLTWNQAGKCDYLEAITSKLILGSKEFREAASVDESRWRDLRIFRTFFSAQSYMRFVILNNSRKKLSHLTLFDNEWSDLFQIDQGPTISVERGQPMVLGDVQPGREIVLHLWSSSNIPVWNPDTRKRFKFSADELDRVKIKEPMQEFLKRRYQHRILKYLAISTWATLVGLSGLAYFGGDIHIAIKW
ncbi:hypothetical protein SAMN05444159_4636 [Bradyrhizobium lablabi]|uniref:Uncharacterized protein n=1 Tax=Bradyrhizobium lablabi TaxID=722472 RepID=A0A1M6WQW8_9BRAD|nr:hypothetical protein [Bradyrhizobium lablabi]SHK96066.1 hypothetical protein SAMN05444159_4636 [Bradyrhizobium lablabi]